MSAAPADGQNAARTRRSLHSFRNAKAALNTEPNWLAAREVGGVSLAAPFKIATH